MAGRRLYATALKKLPQLIGMHGDLVSCGAEYCRRKLKAQIMCAFGEILDPALTVSLCVVVLPGLDVGVSFGQHELPQTGQLVCGSGNCRGPLHARTPPTVIGTACRLAFTPCLGRQA